jgi:hypothetical protein
MPLTYFDARRELRKIYHLSVMANKSNDTKYINYAVLGLEQLEKALNDTADINNFGKHIIAKEIKSMRVLLDKTRNKRMR